MTENTPNPLSLTTGQCATMACLMEVAAPKPGNVHRGADFADLTLNDFLLGAVAIGPAIERAAQRGVGETVLSAIRATRGCVDSNTNLGTVLLLAPLASVPRDQPLAEGVAQVLGRMTPLDCQQVYEAIRLAKPGGMGEVADMDVAGQPPEDLLDAMRDAADRDMVARQYVEDFRFVIEFVAREICAGYDNGWSLPHAIIHTQLEILVRHPDSLIARKCGESVACDVSRRASDVLSSGAPGDERYEAAVADFDFWLRCDGNRRNPGTTADLIAAGLFVVLRDELIRPPYRHQL